MPMQRLDSMKYSRAAETKLCVGSIRHLEMIVFFFILINLASHHFCNAFPTLTTRTSQRFDTRHAVGSARLTRSIAIDLVDTQLQTKKEHDVKSVGLWKRFFRRHKHEISPVQNQMSMARSTFSDGWTSAEATTTTGNRFWREAVHGLRARTSDRICEKLLVRGRNCFASAVVSSALNRFGGTRESTVVPISPSTQQRNPFQYKKQRYKSNTSITNMLRISRIQSLATSTSLNMVLSTPESIIEQVSTQKLLDALIDESTRTSSREPVMMQFNPKRGWIWRQWRGTVFSETWKSGLLNMALATFVVFLYKMYPNLKDLLQGFSILWGQLLSVTTFTLTFFLNQSYGLWRKCYDYSRRLQGRLNDLGMSLAAHATRVTPSSPDIPSTYTPQSRQALELVSRYVRVFNLLTYASFTRSHRPILTPRGMRRLVERGILTPKEREILIDAEIPATQRHNAVLVWLIRLFEEGRQTGVFEGGYGFEEQFMEKCHVIRAQYGAIGDELQGRMPLAYAHIVQVLLDVVLWMYPFMALSTGMAWYIGVLGTLLLTMFYQGLFDLAKQFLDPYDNENYGKGDDPLVIDTLIAETNAGSVRWLNSFQQQPWNKQALKDGEMYDYLLPLRGYSVEELLEKEAQEEAERKEKERILQEKRTKEEEKERDRAQRLLHENFEHIKNGTLSLLVEKSNGTAILSPRAERLQSTVFSNAMNKTLLEVSGGQIVSSSSLYPSRTSVLSVEPNKTETDSLSHKVLTLDDGTLVTQDESLVMSSADSETLRPNSVKDDISATVAETPNFEDSINVVKKFKASQRSETNAKLDRKKYDEDMLDSEDFEYDDADFDPFQIEWFEEVGPDGKEMRLSQMLADEDWSYLNDEFDVENESQSITMDYEEFTRRATVLIENVESEIAETKQVLGSSPGSQAEYDAKKKANKVSMPKQRLALEEKEPAYDQTRLDPISQLWGAPPEILGRTMLGNEEEQKEINEDIDFGNVYQLWGGPLKSKLPTEEQEDITSPPLDGVKQLWSESLFDSELAPDTDGDSSSSSAFEGLEWWDKISDDGKEIRLSMMLADEEYDEEQQDEEELQPMTYEQFALETENMIQAVEEERKETELILNAPPNANFLEESAEESEVSSASLEDTFAAVAASEKFEEMVMSLSQGEGLLDGANIDGEGVPMMSYDKDDMSILEMDVDDRDKKNPSNAVTDHDMDKSGGVDSSAPVENDL